MRTSMIVFLLAFFAAICSAQTIVLKLDPEVILPGTSADVVISIQNPGDVSLHLKPEAALRVEGPNGESFFAERYRSLESRFREIHSEFLDSDETELRVEARSTKVVSFPFASTRSFFFDPGLSAPGRHKLSVLMRTTDGREVWSEGASLLVVTPSGIDAVVRDLMRRKCGPEGCAWGEWQDERLDVEILTKYPRSTYAQYATGYMFHSRPDAALRREIGLEGPYREHILLHEAEHLNELSRADAIQKGDRNAAVRAAHEERRALEALIASASDEYVLARAKRALETTPSPARIDEIFRALDAGSPDAPAKTIAPYVNCVAPIKDGGWMTWFGYESPFDYDHWLGIQTGENKFEPKPHERGQTTVFKPGGEARAFSVIFDGEPLTWFVRGEKATASKDFPTRCTE